MFHNLVRFKFSVWCWEVRLQWVDASELINFFVETTFFVILLLFHSRWSLMHAASACGWRDNLTGQLCRTVAQLWLHKIHQLNKQTAGPWRQQRPLGPAGSRLAQLLPKATLCGSFYQTGSQTRLVISGLTKTPVATVGRLLSRMRRLDFWFCVTCSKQGICLFFQGQRKKVLPELCIEKLWTLTN